MIGHRQVTTGVSVRVSLGQSVEDLDVMERGPHDDREPFDRLLLSRHHSLACPKYERAVVVTSTRDGPTAREFIGT